MIARAQPAAPDVVVIGAGAAGIAAARKVIAGGKTVIVIEASDRIGGRAFTESGTFGIPFDHGCQWLQGPGGLPHVDIARAQGFGLVDHNAAGDAFYVGNKPATAAQQRQYDSAFEQISSRVYSAGDVAASSRVPDDLPFSAVAQSWIGPLDFGVDFADLSTGDMNSYGTYAYNYLVREGLGTLVATYGQRLPIRTGVAATAIDWSGQGVRVETTDGTITASACIVTVSTGVLASGAIKFIPDLPVQKAEAIADVPMGLLAKIALQFDGERFGLQDNDFLTYAVPDAVPAEACYFLTWPTGFDLAVGYVGGQFGWDLSRGSVDDAVDFALGEFVNMMGSRARSHFVKGVMTDWATNPLTLGAYAAAKPGRFEARTALATPLGDRVFFAGEAVAGRYKALMSGAHMSGDFIGGEVVNVLSGPGVCGSCEARSDQRERMLEVDEP
ncbi:MAG: NAD(P)/FAD-dependent oxidoreductase [Yoonia sp.]|nr:NAD(P)/FAD-dependent oxidoreductase [Yoonia sp.]